jgi:hypothetical protein
MATVLVPLHVDNEGRITGQAPAVVPPGDYTAPLEVLSGVRGRRDTDGKLDWPVHDCGPWPENLSLRREDLYSDEGR